MALDPKAVETKAVAEANSIWGKAVAAVVAHPKTAIAVAVALILVAIFLF